MKYGHLETQLMFSRLGESLGYRASKIYTPNCPTDGVWFGRHPFDRTREVPVLAIEVLVSESLKIIRGSIRTLERVSPQIAILLLHEGEILGQWLAEGSESDMLDRRMSALKQTVADEITQSYQRFEIWNEHSLWYLNKIKTKEVN
ncbi:hypothetical protein [Paenibacillus planticolens]|uniref:Uncharacterized protein n=1 Tax=Paenibacillus planticolens TaxID=2654976 RepID=A0ABX1ZHC1_9BACL|nr:hypothetical protein [Paenibacillus planticolens]NOU99490.1 hypothetical protein [Paenibacillus planticolens]